MPGKRAAKADRNARLQTTPLFGDVVSGVDGSPEGVEAAAQAAALLDPGGRLTLVAIIDRHRFAANESGTEATAAAQAALEDARRAAIERGAEATTEIVHAADKRDALLERAHGADLLAVGSHQRSRARGIVSGSVATAALHRASTAVLIARPPPPEVRFPSSIVVATDGSPHAQRAAEIALELVRRVETRVTVVTGDLPDDPDLHGRVAAQSADFFEAAGVEPLVLSYTADLSARIVEVARTENAALVLMGSRGTTGVRAIGSVSERVAHRATCSVLIARPTP